MERLENIILTNLLYNEEYTRKTLPFIQEEYFSQFSEKAVFQEIRKYFNKYSNIPSKEALIIELNERNDLTEEHFQTTTELLKDAEEFIADSYSDEVSMTIHPKYVFADMHGNLKVN